MLVINLVPNNAVSGNAVPVRTTGRRPGDPGHRCPHRHSISSESEPKKSYCVLKTKWMLGRCKSEEPPNKSYRLFERRLSFPLYKVKKEIHQEMSMPVKSNASWWRISNNGYKRSLSLKFWKNDDYFDALENVDIACAEDVIRVIQVVQNKIKLKSTTATDLAEIVQHVYRITESKLREKVVFHLMTAERAYNIMEEFEENFMRNIHDEVFDRIAVEEEESDSYLTSTIESFCWVTPKHLAAKIDETKSAVLDCLDKAMLALATINFRESATEKLNCIMDCSKRIFDSLSHYGKAEGADDFLPVLIYVVLQANPARLHSNIRYVLQFSNTDRIMKGEEGYYFTHLCSVVSYIENLSAKSLSMSEEEFSRNLEANEKEQEEDLKNGNVRNYRRLSRYICEIYRKTAERQVFEERQDKLWDKTTALQQKLNSMRESLTARQALSQRKRKSIEELMCTRYANLPGPTDCPICNGSV